MVRIHAAVIATAGAVLACASAAEAQRPPTMGLGAPSGQSGIQLYNFSSYISGNNPATNGEIVCPDPPAAPTPYCVGPPAPATSAARLERVFQFLQSRGIKDVELYGYPGNPFPGTNPATPLNIAGLTALRALGDQYGLRFTGRHGNLNEPNWDNHIIASKILGQDHVGESGFPGGGGAFNTYQGALNTAQLLNRLGKRSVEAGLGPAYFHNHQPEFQTRHLDNGVLKSAWEIIMERTDPRWVVAQIDVGWAICGASGHANPIDPAVGAQYVIAMINKFSMPTSPTNRIISFHVKDVDNVRPTCGNPDQRELGQGDIDYAPIFAAAKNRVKYYFSERDPVPVTPPNPTNFNPFINTANSAVAMKSDPAPVLYAFPPTFTSVAAGTAAAANQVPVTVTNDGDAPLNITAVSVQAAAEDGGAATAADFSIVSHNCTTGAGGGPLAPARAAIADNPATPDVNESAPAVPAGTCVVNVGFKPSRTNYTSVARLQFTSNSDDAMERVLLAAKSTGDAIGTVGGDVPSTLALGLPAQPGSFGTFQPMVTRTYETAMAATVTSTAGDATLAVADQSTNAPGHLVNGAFALPQILNVRASNGASGTGTYAPLAEATGTPTNLLTYTGPVNGDIVTLGFRQLINSGDVLRTGNYNKTLTFTLSTTAP
jgi:sugar phosphate isomerase/epimerase